MRYDAHILGEDRPRVIHVDKDSDQEAIAWANAQWEGAHWTTMAGGFRLLRENGAIILTRRRYRLA